MSNYEKVKEWRKNNPEKVAEQAIRYRKKHPETGAKASKKYYEKDIDASREKHKLKAREYRRNKPELQKARAERYKIKFEAALWEIAGTPRADQCEICLVMIKTVFDHCHINGNFRGWICDRCNRVLGSVKDNILLLKAMIKYLESANDKINNEKKK